MVQTLTGNAPFSLVYKCELVIPLEYKCHHFVLLWQPRCRRR